MNHAQSSTLGYRWPFPKLQWIFAPLTYDTLVVNSAHTSEIIDVQAKLTAFRNKISVMTAKPRLHASSNEAVSPFV